MMSYRSLLVIPLMILLGCKDYALKEPFRAPNGLYGYKDGEGKIRIEAKYDEAYPFREGLATVGLNNKRGLIDKTGEEVIPLEYDDVGRFSEGLAPVLFNRKWGYVDVTNKVIIYPKYDLVGNFREGLAAVRLNGKRGVINTQGQEYWSMTED